MNQNESLNYFEKFFNLAAPTVQHQVISLLRPFFPLEEQQQLKNLSPLYKQIIGMITFLIVKQEVIIEELQKQNLESHRFKALMELVDYYRELKANKNNRLAKVFDSLADKPTAQAVITDLTENLKNLFQFKFKMDSFHANYQMTVMAGINDYANRHGFQYNSQNPELASLYDMAKVWHEKPAPSIEQLQQIGVQLPTPKPEATLSDEERAKVFAEVQEVIKVNDLNTLGIKMHPKIRAIFQKADGNKISIGDAGKLTSIFLDAAKKDDCQQIITNFTREAGLNVTEPEKLQKMIEKLNGVGAELRTIDSLKPPSSTLFPTPSRDKQDLLENEEQVRNWPPKLTPKTDPFKG